MVTVGVATKPAERYFDDGYARKYWLKRFRKTR